MDTKCRYCGIFEGTPEEVEEHVTYCQSIGDEEHLTEPGEQPGVAGPLVVILGGSISGYGAWGRGADEQEAKRNFRREGGLLSKGYTRVDIPAGCTFVGVTGMGYVTFKGTTPTSVEVPPAVKR